MAGLALPCRSDGPILPNDRRLGYEANNWARACPRRDHDGSAAAAAVPSDHSLGPRLTVRKRRLAALLLTNHLEPSMSRRGNCWDNAVAESFFSSLKKERIKKRIYRNREIAHADISEYIESFYNQTRRHSHLGGVSPEDFEAAGKRRRRVH